MLSYFVSVYFLMHRESLTPQVSFPVVNRYLEAAMRD